MSTPSAMASTSRRGLARWSVAAVATAALVVSGSGLVVFAQSGAGESQGPDFVPAGAANDTVPVDHKHRGTQGFDDLELHATKPLLGKICFA